MLDSAGLKHQSIATKRGANLAVELPALARQPLQQRRGRPGFAVRLVEAPETQRVGYEFRPGA